MLSRHAFRIFLLAAAALLLETTLTRLLAVAQFYHFAFLVVSLALLGFGASGTLLCLWPGLSAAPLERTLSRAASGFALSVGLAYAVVNLLPFDSYAIAWERRQVLFLVLTCLALTLPFLLCGLAIGAALAASAGRSHAIYAANLVGSGVGALLAPLFLTLAGVPGAVLASAWLGLLAAARPRLRPGLAALLLGGALVFGWLTTLNFQSRAPLGLAISPYKGLAQVRRYPAAEILFSRWNAISRLDVAVGGGVHQLPGLSYLYAGLPPQQLGLALDADALQAVTLSSPGDFAAASYLPESLAFDLRPGAQVLVLEPGGGLGVLQALAGGAAQVTAVVENRLVTDAMAQVAPEFDVYALPRVRTLHEGARAALARRQQAFDLVFIPLSDAYRPVASGAFSLSEHYLLTVEGLQAALGRLSPGGVLAISRWLQTPPSEEIRLLATLAAALEQRGCDPVRVLVAYRSIQTLTALVKPDGWTGAELAAVRAFAEERRFDLVWLPGIDPVETNRFNRLPEPVYYLAVRDLLGAPDRAAFYAASAFDITPPTDDRPFFFHFFTWQQTPQVLASLGHTWQPFGGSGYLVLLALLALALLLGLALILLPLRFSRAAGRAAPPKGGWMLLYFALLGFAFLYIEIPLIQRWILLLGHPTYAFAAVVLALLLGSGAGSALARHPRLPGWISWGLLVALAGCLPWGVMRLSALMLAWPGWARLAGAALSLAPLGFLMGLPFPRGLAWLEDHAPGWAPWAWAVNGCASVSAAVLAAILALQNGFSLVLWLGAGAYGAAAIIFWGVTRR